jgi:hypothetical protein
VVLEAIEAGKSPHDEVDVGLVAETMPASAGEVGQGRE